MADLKGCSISELVDSIPPQELHLRAVNRLVMRGYSFDREKIHKAEIDAFKQQAYASLGKP